MKILVVTHYSGVYGANLSMFYLIKQMINEKIFIHVLLPSQGPMCEVLEINNIPYTILSYDLWVTQRTPSNLLEWLRSCKWHTVKLYQYYQYSKIFKSFRFDLVYTNSITINIGAILAMSLRIPHLWHFRETMEQFNFKYSIGRLLSKLFYNCSTERYIVISDYVKASMANELPQNRVHMIYDGVTLPKNYNRIYTNSGVFNICLTGVINWNKGQLTALGALKEIVYRYDEKSVCLNIVGDSGGDSKYMSEVENFVRQHELQPYVKFWGYRSDVHEILKNMDLGIMCSKNEAFGRVTVEYMLHGMPVVASNSGANRELVKNEFGEIYKYGDEKDLALKIIKYIKNRDLIKQHGDIAKKWAINNFSSELNADRIIALVREIIKK